MIDAELSDISQIEKADLESKKRKSREEPDDKVKEAAPVKVAKKKAVRAAPAPAPGPFTFAGSGFASLEDAAASDQFVDLSGGRNSCLKRVDEAGLESDGNPPKGSKVCIYVRRLLSSVKHGGMWRDGARRRCPRNPALCSPRYICIVEERRKTYVVATAGSRLCESRRRVPSSPCCASFFLASDCTRVGFFSPNACARTQKWRARLSEACCCFGRRDRHHHLGRPFRPDGCILAPSDRRHVEPGLFYFVRPSLHRGGGGICRPQLPGPTFTRYNARLCSSLILSLIIAAFCTFFPKADRPLPLAMILLCPLVVSKRSYPTNDLSFCRCCTILAWEDQGALQDEGCRWGEHRLQRGGPEQTLRV